jgi:hypothetical protein
VNSKRPPEIATWLLEHFAYRVLVDPLIGDLIEQYQRGRSRFWYCRQVLAFVALHAWRSLRHGLIPANGGDILLKIAATILTIGLFITTSTLVVINAPMDPIDWTTAGGVLCLINLALLILRGVWRSSSKVVDGLYWPTLTVAALLGLSGIETVIATLWLARENGVDVYLVGVGACVILICVATAFMLRPRRVSA